MENEPIELKDTVEIPARTFSMELGRAPLTSREVTTEYTAAGDLAGNAVAGLLSPKPLRRAPARKQSGN